MERRTVQQTLRSLALRTTCTALALDVRLMPGSCSTALLTFQLDGLLGSISDLKEWPAADLQGQLAPGAGQHVLAALSEAVPVPRMEDLCATPAFPHAELRQLLADLSGQLAEGQQIDASRLLHGCQQLRAAICGLQAGGAL